MLTVKLDLFWVHNKIIVLRVRPCQKRKKKILKAPSPYQETSLVMVSIGLFYMLWVEIIQDRTWCKFPSKGKWRMLSRRPGARVLTSHQPLSTFGDQSSRGVIKTQDILTWKAISRFLPATWKIATIKVHPSNMWKLPQNVNGHMA